MSKKDKNIDDEKYNDYLRFRNENDKIRVDEQAKMGHIIITCSIGLIGIAFAFVALIYNEKSICWLLFSLSILFSCLAIVSNYFSSWCSVKDICLSNDELDKRYQEEKNIYEEIRTKYTSFISTLNVFSIIFLVFSVVLFFIFVYVNMEMKKVYNAKGEEMQSVLCEGNEKNKPTVPKNQGQQKNSIKKDNTSVKKKEVN